MGPELLRAPTVSGPPFVTWVEHPVSVTLPVNQNSRGTVFLSKNTAGLDTGNRQFPPLPPDHVEGTVLGPMGQSLCPSHQTIKQTIKPSNFSKGHVLEYGAKFYGTIRSTHLFLTDPSL